eukprot:Nitzschia sp. Nitz4//scaffold26_size159584//45912//46922//NITZ4_ECH//-1//CDS//3329545178//8024//frame0
MIPPTPSSGPFPSQRGTLQMTQRGSIRLVALSRPHVKNAMNDDMYLDLVQVLQETSIDDAVSGIVLTGTGPFFSSGADLQQASRQQTAAANAYQKQKQIHRPPAQFMHAMIAYPKFIAAAVNGPAIGIGTTLLLHCDLVYCTSRATFWTPFSRIALVPEFASSQLLQRRMGIAKANELLLLAKPIDAYTAVAWNICSRVVLDKEQAAATATATATAASPSGSNGCPCATPSPTVPEDPLFQNGIDVQSGDPFHPDSLASRMCQELQQRLLSLPESAETIRYFVRMVRNSHAQERMEWIAQELEQLDERYEKGQVRRAVMALQKQQREQKAKRPKSRL